MSKQHRIGVAFLGGGSGGHIYPALAVAHAIEPMIDDARAVFLTGDRAADGYALADKIVFGRPAERVALGARPLSFRPIGFVRLLASWGASVRESREALRDLKATCDRVVAMSTGGFVSAPAAQAASVERVPLALVSLDARIGKANRFVARRARRRMIAQHTGSGDWEAIGPIVGPLAMAPGDQAACRRMLGLLPDVPTLVVMGGSQGATSINRFMEQLAHGRPELLSGWQVLHLAGDAQATEQARRAYEDANIPAIVADRLWPIGPAWGAADLAICRGGAGTVAEAHANAVPAIYLPYPYHKDAHQAANAQALVDAGGGLIERDRIEPRANLDALAPILAGLLGDASRRASMARALGQLPRRDGAAAAARALKELAGS